MVTMIRSDLDFILAQIKIAEADAAGVDLLATGILPNSEVPWGLRRVDGSNNNLIPGQEAYGAAGELFPRTDPAFRPNDQDGDSLLFGPPGTPPSPGTLLTNTNYGVIAANNPAITRGIQPGDVVDADPRIISNLIVDQTLNNPAAIAAALKEAGNPASTLLTDIAAIQTAYNELKAAAASGGTGNAVATAALALSDAQDDFNAASAALQSATNTSTAYQTATLLDNGAITAAELASIRISQLQTAFNSGAIVGLSDINAANAAVAAATEAANAVVSLLASLELAASPNVATTVISGLTSDANDILADLVAFRDEISSQDPLTAISNEQRETILDLESRAATLSLNLTDVTPILNASLVTAEAALTTAQFNLATETTELETAQDAYDLAVANADASDVAAKTAQLNAVLEGYGISYEPHASGDFTKATLYIGNVAADEGLSAPFNGWMTLFGQFFDHGLDLVAKGGFGTVYIPLQPDDPLYVPGSATNFMALTRATVNTDGEATNLVTPFVDQNQTYTSHASHQVFLREYVRDAGVTEATGRLLDGNAASGNGLATWADVKAEAISKLGIRLSDIDIHSVPLLRADPYGNFVPGANGFAQVVVEVTETINGASTKTNVFIEGVAGGLDIHNLTVANLPFTATEGATYSFSVVPTGVAFLDDIAHAANPGANETADNDNALGLTGNSNLVYDNELLDAHYITGDGRGNENIGLTAVHHVFHAEHNRQVDLIQNLLVTDGDLDFLNEWLDTDITQTQLDALNAITDEQLKKDAIENLDWDGERIFQAAKLPTEMQYQHLVFEEFARKVQPAVNVFNDYDGTLDPAILAEFAHTVYRFGHSMLTETVDRYNADWDSLGTGGVAGDQIGLIEAFLNPLEFAANDMTAEEAAGVIAQGMTRQRGSEIDEFVTEALRNNLVGLPLDLAALNIARGRETGVPTLNAAREDFYEGSGDAQVKPYASWFEFMQNLKNPASVINFIAAYGTHQTILDAEGTDAKRAAATALVLGGPGVSDTDRLDFLNARGTYLNDPKLGGLNNIDFWIGGLAEKKLIFGGMLGSTFNFVFEAQLEALQNGDRFYYLSRLANLNLTAQLENNKFSEMIHRTTTATHLPGDAFARPDFFLEADISKQFNADLGIGVDPTTVDVELDPFTNAASGGGTNGVVLRTDADQDGIAERLEYTGAEHVVLGGTSGNDHLIGGKGDDTLWGDAGDDRLEGGDGNDFIFGGEGNDIITDIFGIDEIRSGAGDDVVSAGRGIKLIITDTGNDWVWGGVDDDEVLAGQGDDFVNGGDGADFLIGGEGNDWLESGTENGLMLGDNGDLIQGLPIKRSVDSRIVGHDVLVATGGNADFDAETGDDIMVGGLGTDRFFGQFGFDWATYKNDPFGIEADMNQRLFAPPSLPASPGAILDRYAQTEGLSGSSKSDILRGDDIADLAGGAGDAGAIVDGLDHALYDVNVGLINGLNELLGNIDEGGSENEVRFSGGNILLGGDASDIIEGRGGNDLIDGDSWLNVRIERISTGESQDTMAGFQQRVLAGQIPVADLKIVREILDTSGAQDIDVAEFSGLLADYEVEGYDALRGVATDVDGNGFISVSHLTRDATGAVVPGVFGVDGVDQLKNVERLLFADGTVKITRHENRIAEGRVTIDGLAADGIAVLNQELTASIVNVTDRDGIADPVEYYWQVEAAPGTGLFTNITSIVADEFAPVKGETFTVTAAEAGLAVRVVARFMDGKGALETVYSNADEGGNPNDPATIALDGFNTTTRTFADNFDTASTGWVESGDGANTVTTGTIQIDQGNSNQLRFNVGTANGATITRALDLAGSTSVVVTFAIDDQSISAGGGLLGNDDERLEFQYAADGVNFTTLATFNGDNVGNQSIALPDGAGFTASAAIRFRMVGTPDNDFGFFPERFSVDNFTVTANNTQTVTPSIPDISSIFTEGQAAISVGSEPLIVDEDGTILTSARVVLTNASAGDVLAIGALPVGIIGSVATAGTTIVATLTGTASLTAYQAAVQAVTYRNTSDNPSVTARVIEVTVNDGIFDSDPAIHTVNVVPVNDAPNAVTDNVVTNIAGPILIPEWVMLRNDTDADGDLLDVTNATENDAGFTISFNGEDVIATRSDVDNTKDLTYTVSDGQAIATADVDITWDTVGTVSGTNGADIILGDGANSTFDGSGGNDLIIAGAGNDTILGGGGNDDIHWNAGDGRDGVNGEAGTDTIVINGDATSETFGVYTRAAAIAAGLTGIALNTEIVITRNGSNNASIVAELDNIEEIVINTLNVSANDGNGVPNGGSNDGDAVQIFGNFVGTSLNFSTITITGSAGDDTVDISSLQSAHRIVFKSNGGNDIIVGNLRPQDVVELPSGQDLSTYSLQNAGNGLMTYTNGSHSISFTGAVPPQFQNSAGNDGNIPLDDEDLEDLRDMVRDGLVRDSSGYGNNVDNPTWGTAGHQFIRLTDAHFTDGVSGIRETDLTPREISDILSNQDNDGDGQEESIPNAFGGTSLLTFFGQYFDHGLDFVAKGQPGSVPIGSATFPINAPRSNIVPGTGIDPDGVPNSGDEIPAEYVNNASPYVDQNQAYGSHDEITNLLRKWVPGPSGGQPQQSAYLLTGALDETGRALLPTLADIRDNYRIMTGGDEITAADISNYNGTGQALLIDFIPVYDQQGQLDLDAIGHYYVTGDGRSNENVMLTSIHTIWARNHNYWVDTLKAKTNGAWTESEYFEAARMMNIAEYQRVVFTEFATAMAGGLDNDDEHGFTGYDPMVDASISVEFAQAAYRFGHSMLNETVSYVDGNGQLQQISLVDAFLRPDVVASGGINALLAGSVEVQHQAIDVDVVNALRNQLVGRPLDLAALNIFRGRDMGIAPFNSVREQLYETTGLASLRPYTGWDDFQQRNGLSNDLIAKVKLAYSGDFEAIDLWVGGLLEKPQAGQLGSTFGYIFLEQLNRLQNGDRLYYLEIFDDSLFSGENDITFAEIIERTTGLTGLPADVFDIDQSNAPANDDDSIFNNDDEESESEHDDDDTTSDDDEDDSESEGDEDEAESEDDEDETESEDDEDDDTTAPPPPNGSGNGTGTGTGTANSAFVVYLGTAASDTAFGAGLGDLLSGGDKDDNLFGFAGDDTITGGDGDDHLDGGDGHDNLLGNAGDDTLKGGAGNDELDGGAGNDRIDGGDGDDTVYGGAGRDVIKTGLGNDTIFAFDNDGSDVIDAGDETGDSDTLDMSAISGNITVFLSANGSGSANVAGGDTDSIKGIENVITGSGDDVIIASTDVNVLEGGGGSDTFVFNSVAAANGDTISDFQDGDLIVLSSLFPTLNLGEDVLSTDSVLFNANGEFLRLKIQGDDTLVEGSTDANADVEFAIRILGRTDLEQKDFA